ncbi:GNAT family N-acetyltransferase [Streptomyces radicis]|uniref:GNAT family N-acetyltransferase n=1 Tax=Streptomyces radicis TaxID=1750517 RepID=A0A3A9WI37_9ACTN|nr:GNAT family N-acetyltransferase [Streptomyces radicis]RKN12688.1 GNAT family N-acetyltransferase [Streptomyces radicis]RKN27548.1 GNAT family N-acetyltransferase [Streptomyces radicis]
MTTTLRPAGPEESGADGLRSRPFDIRVNGRRAGALRLTVYATEGDVFGRIAQLEIAPDDRRRGRATVAALAAEEVLRGEGCRQVVASVPAAAGGALELARSLGYVERNLNMAKELPERPPSLPPGLVARAMTGPEFEDWRVEARERYVREWVERGVPETTAEERGRSAHATLLPEGLATERAALRVLTHEDLPVGTLWLSTDPERLPHGADAYVFSVAVDEKHRGRGHGRALMLEAERLTRAAGGRVLGLNVFAGNTPALRLYASLGYRPVEHHLYKPLG